MNPDDPLKPMGVQSADTVQVEAAERAKKVKEQIEQGSATSEASSAKAERAAEDVAQWFRMQTKVAGDMTGTFIRERPIEAMLLACAGGALLMGLTMLASRSD